jgi:hypothetical protein
MGQGIARAATRAKSPGASFDPIIGMASPLSRQDRGGRVRLGAPKDAENDDDLKY